MEEVHDGVEIDTSNSASEFPSIDYETKEDKSEPHAFFVTKITTHL